MDMKIRSNVVGKSFKTTNRKVNLIGGNSNYCRKKFSFKNDDGGVVSGICVKKLDLNGLPENVTKAFYSENIGGLFVVADGGCYVKSDKLNLDFYQVSESGDGQFIVDMNYDGKNYAVVYSGKNRVGVSSEGMLTLTEGKVFVDAVMHFGRLFGCEKGSKKLWWSGFNAFEWKQEITGCGWVELPPDGGNVLRLFSCDEKLLCVRERGITIVRAYGEPQHYKVEASANYLTADNIIGDSCAICAGELYFCTDSGIFAFDGTDIERQENSDESDIYSYTSAVGFGDRYYVICDSRTHGAGKLYVYEPEEEVGYFVELSPDCLVACDKVLAFAGGEVFELTDRCEGVWVSDWVDFDNSSPKLLRQVKLDCDGDFKVEVESGGLKRIIDGGSMNNFNFAGIKFRFTVSGSGKVYKFEVVAEVRDGL
jgi:hypothetical protein